MESGTDFTDQTRSMAKIRGGIRATNETDSYAQNFYATRMISSAARFYRVPFGTEPASFGSARGVSARIFNILVNNGRHLFFYHPNLLNNDQAVEKWFELAPLLDRREEPLVEVPDSPPVRIKPYGIHLAQGNPAPAKAPMTRVRALTDANAA